MIVILEGLDGCSKTTQGNYLSSNLNMINFKESDTNKHFIPFKKEPEKWKYYVGGINAQTINVFSSFDNFIKDRFHISEYVYSKFFNRESILPFSYIDNFLSELNTNIFLFYLQINVETFQIRTKDKNDEGVYTDNEFKELNKLFLEGFNKSKLKNKFIIDANIPKIEISKVIVELLCKGK